MVSKRMASAVVLAMAAVTMTGCLHRNDGPAPYRASNGFHPFGGGRKPAPAAPIGVNGYLWRATLDTLAFMPLASADPFGGVIITDWYSAPSDSGERMKVTIYILDRRLRADGIKIAVFRQTHSSDGWIDAQVNPETATKLEDAILTRARELRLASENSGS
jgi:hypothetical protein